MNKKIFTIPNLLSFIRIILVPIIVVLYLKKHLVAATVLVVVSGASDMLDGFIARTFNQVSDLGKLLDPIADKLTMLAVVFLVAIHHLPMRVMLYVMMAKEGIMLLGALVLFNRFCVGRRTHSFGKMPVDNGRRMLCAYDCRTYPIYCHFYTDEPRKIRLRRRKNSKELTNETHTLLKMQKTPRRGFYNQNGGG